jgi:hypothetical protein
VFESIPTGAVVHPSVQYAYDREKPARYGLAFFGSMLLWVL